MKHLIQYLMSWPLCPKKYFISLPKLGLHPKSKGPKNNLNLELNPEDMSLQSVFFKLIPSGLSKPLKDLFASSHEGERQSSRVTETHIR